MIELIVHIFERLLRVLHRVPATQDADTATPLRPVRVEDPAPKVRLRFISPMAAEPDTLRGEDSALVRPYVLAQERRRREQRARRRALWFALHGVDLDCRDIHGLGLAR